ncbi:hypothetical protein [Roseomonas populi]|uniref:MFS transporter n=1 Tax=Roseomonas populi TaxID=3121582 RepID=A0ABT1X3X9_9PROT|nr:hypothetical protein [Roseomonas pecuniae]MCR0982810.1 hypothetical protein [Roseomonas pecuniae]
MSAAWVGAAFAVAQNSPRLVALMLIAYPAWDAIANVLDASRSGGLARNGSQILNVVNLSTGVAVAVALGRSMNAVLIVYGV